MKLYKLTDENSQTRNKMQWGDGIERTAPGGGPLCTDRWLHAYTDPLIAVLMAPVYGYTDGVLWEAEGDVGLDDGTKVGCTRLKTVRQMALPVVTAEQRIRFGILCALEVYHGEVFVSWAAKWLSGEERMSCTSILTYVLSAIESDEIQWEGTWAAKWAVQAAYEQGGYMWDGVARAARQAASAALADDAEINFVELAHRALN